MSDLLLTATYRVDSSNWLRYIFEDSDVSERTRGFRMSQIDSTIVAFNEYLREGPPGLSKSSASNYTSAIKHVLVGTSPEDLTNMQMLSYLRTGLLGTYQINFPAAWKCFQKFCLMEDIELPDLPEHRRVRFVHPVYPDVMKLFTKFYNGIPEGLTWEKFFVTEQDESLKFAAIRIYEFFSGAPQPMTNQPLVARSAHSLEPIPSWVLESIATSRARRTSGLAEQFHANLNSQLADSRMPAGVSKIVYQSFVAGQAAIRRRKPELFEGQFVQWENMIRSRDAYGLISSVRDYCNISKDANLDEIMF